LILETWDDSFNPKGGIPMLATYETLLARRPIALKTLLSGTCACLGDTAAQYGEYLRGQHCPAPPAASPSHGALAAPFAVDRQRTGAFTSLAAFWNGPLLHVHFNNLERWFPQRIGLRSVVSKTMVNQIVWNPFVWLPVFYMWTGFAYWRTLDEIITKARREYWTSLKATWIVFTPVNLANFYFVPVRHQVTTNVAVSFVYSLTLSFLAAPRASDNAFVDGSAR
jgi:protein Mpv17